MKTLSKNPLLPIFISGFLFTSLLGTLNHFVYDWSGQNVVAGLFTPVNESIWEHIKLLFFPMLLFTLYVQLRYGKEYPCLTVSLLWGILLGSLLIPVLYYSYTGALGFHRAAIDIAIYYISVFVAFCKSYFHYKLRNNCSNIFVPRFLILSLFAAFLVFTFVPPQIPLFMAP